MTKSEMSRMVSWRPVMLSRPVQKHLYISSTRAFQPQSKHASLNSWRSRVQQRIPRRGVRQRERQNSRKCRCHAPSQLNQTIAEIDPHPHHINLCTFPGSCSHSNPLCKNIHIVPAFTPANHSVSSHNLLSCCVQSFVTKPASFVEVEP